MDEQQETIYLAQLAKEQEIQRERQRQIQVQSATTMFSGEDNENLVRFQLDIKEELERIEHLLKKHVPQRDAQGNEYFIDPAKENMVLNEWGVQEILNLLAWYLNKNIILSNFSSQQINVRCMQLSRKLSNFIFMNYEKMGLDTKEKIKHYPLIVMNVVNTIEASYNRALNGGERQSLREARSVVQNESLSPQQFYPGVQQQKSGMSRLNPMSWGRR